MHNIRESFSLFFSFFAILFCFDRNFKNFEYVVKGGKNIFNLFEVITECKIVHIIDVNITDDCQKKLCFFSHSESAEKLTVLNKTISGTEFSLLRIKLCGHCLLLIPCNDPSQFSCNADLCFQQFIIFLRNAL